MNLKVAIQCVPERVKQVQRIESFIKGIGLECKHYMDFERNGTIWNFNRIINDLSYIGTSHLLFLQDDVLFSDNFEHHIKDVYRYSLLNNVNGISLFTPPRKYYKDAYSKGTKYYIEKNFLWMQAMLFSPNYLKGLRDFKDDTSHDDVFVANYAKHSNDYVRVLIPSIVQHDLSIKSSIGTPNKIGKLERKSQLFNNVNKGYYAP